MCRDKVDEDGIQQLLCDSVSLHDDGTHQVHHVQLHLLVMAVTVGTQKETKRFCLTRRNEEDKEKQLWRGNKLHRLENL